MALTPPTAPAPLLTSIGLAARLEVSLHSVRSRAWRLRHGLSEIRIGRSVRFSEEEVAKLIRRGTARNGGQR